MGWLWSSTSSPSPDKTEAPTPVDKEPTASSTLPRTSQPSNTTTDPEIQKFLELFESDKTSNSSTPTPLQGQSSSSSLPSWLSVKKSAPAATPSAVDIPPGDPLSEALLPEEMSCRNAFDQAWACNSMGGQWNAVYRYGEMRSCTEHWDDFWFCMRTRGYSPEMRARAIKEHYRAKEFFKYKAGKPSSEDVWESRDEKVPEDSTFKEPIE